MRSAFLFTTLYQDRSKREKRVQIRTRTTNLPTKRKTQNSQFFDQTFWSFILAFLFQPHLYPPFSSIDNIIIPYCSVRRPGDTDTTRRPRLNNTNTRLRASLWIYCARAATLPPPLLCNTNFLSASTTQSHNIHNMPAHTHTQTHTHTNTRRTTATRRATDYGDPTKKTDSLNYSRFRIEQMLRQRSSIRGLCAPTHSHHHPQLETTVAATAHRIPVRVANAGASWRGRRRRRQLRQTLDRFKVKINHVAKTVEQRPKYIGSAINMVREHLMISYVKHTYILNIM